jgi:hypothetical protein
MKPNRAIPVWYSYLFNVGLLLWSLAGIGIGGYLVNTTHSSTLSVVYLIINIFYACTAMLGLGLRHVFGGFPLWMTCLCLMTVFQLVIMAIVAARPADSHYKMGEMDRNRNFPKLSTFLRDNHEAFLAVLGTGFGLMVLEIAAAFWMRAPERHYKSELPVYA